VEGGVSQEQTVWLIYSNAYEGTSVAWLKPSGRVLGAIRLPLARAQMMGVGSGSVAYVCSGAGPRINANPECVALMPGEEEPTWHVTVEEMGEQLQGGAFAEDRFYIVLNALGDKTGYMHALGPGTKMDGARRAPKPGQEPSPSPSREPDADASSEPLETGQAPVPSPTAIPTVVPTREPTSTAVTGVNGQVCRVLHEVKAGEYLLKIADDYDVPIKAIMKANGMNRESANKIRSGQIICIP
jgi:LysM repeat protein